MELRRDRQSGRRLIVVHRIALGFALRDGNATNVGVRSRRIESQAPHSSFAGLAWKPKHWPLRRLQGIGTAPLILVKCR